MKKKYRICFIDDEQDELIRTKQVLSSHFDVGVGQNLDDAVDSLPRKPHLFLLDLYYGPKTKPADRIQVAKEWRELCQKQQLFYDLLRRLGQSREGGLKLAEQIRARYRGVPIVFFTRKGSLEDANEALMQGAAEVLKKPDYSDDQHDAAGIKKALDSAMVAHQGQIVRRFSHIIDGNRWWARHERFRGFIEGIVVSLIASLIWKCIEIVVHSV